MEIIGIVLVAGGTWIFQDALASILYYLKSNENWYFNQLVRVLRCIWGIVFIVIGVVLI